MWVTGSEDVYSAAVDGDHTRVKPGCAIEPSRKKTEKLIASPAEEKYLYQLFRKGGSCSMLDPDEISKLKERIDELGKKE